MLNSFDITFYMNWSWVVIKTWDLRASLSHNISIADEGCHLRCIDLNYALFVIKQSLSLWSDELAGRSFYFKTEILMGIKLADGIEFINWALGAVKALPASHERVALFRTEYYRS